MPVGEIAAAIEIVEAFLVGIGQGAAVIGLATGKTARERPEPVGLGLGLAQPGVGEETGDTSVAVQERMNPGEAMMGGSGGDKALRGWLHQRAIEIGEAPEKRGQVFAGGRDVLANADFGRTQFAG